MGFRPGATELIIILVILLLLFGASRLPQLGGSLGKGIKEFRKGVSSLEEPDKKPRGTTQKKARSGAKKT